MKILLVEPDKVLAGTTLREFDAQGHAVRWARNAQTAVDAVDADMPDVIILELQLGIHNGIELLYELRSYTEWQGIPVVLYTINRRVCDEDFVETLGQLGVRGIYYKTEVNPRQLRQKINQLQLV